MKVMCSDQKFWDRDYAWSTCFEICSPKKKFLEICLFPRMCLCNLMTIMYLKRKKAEQLNLMHCPMVMYEWILYILMKIGIMILWFFFSQNIRSSLIAHCVALLRRWNLNTFVLNIPWFTWSVVNHLK